jgi:ATP-binding cassette subfamily B protein RaxB
MKFRLGFRQDRRHRVRFMEHATECDSAIACLAIVSEFYGKREELSGLKKKHLELSGPTSIERLIDLASTIGLSARRVGLRAETINQLSTPCLLHFGNDQYVVMEKIKHSRVVIQDPGAGTVHVSVQELLAKSPVAAVEITTEKAFTIVDSYARISLRSLTGTIPTLWKSVALVLVLAVVLEIVSLASPFFLQTVVDRVLPNEDGHLLMVVGVGFLLLMFLRVGVSTLRTWTVACLGVRVNWKWAAATFSHLMQLSESYFQARQVGDILSRFESLTTIQQTLTARFAEAILDGLMATLTLLVLFIYNVKLALISLIASMCYTLSRALRMKAVRQATQEQLFAKAQEQSQFLEALRGVRTIRLHNQGAERSSRFSYAVARSLTCQLVVDRFAIAFASLNSLIFGVERVLVLWAGATIVLHGNMSIGMLLAFVAYSDWFSARAASLIDYLISLKLLALQLDRVSDIVSEFPETHVRGDYCGPFPKPTVEFRGIGFRYSAADPWIFRQFNLTINAGEFVAISGPSGCGKSTLAKLLLGLVDPEEGSIAIGNTDMKALGKSRLRAMTGTIMQEDSLFAGSFADNISSFDPQATFCQIENAARAAAVHADIVACPQGYHSHIGDMGSSLSGGQKQRILLARELYRNPLILVMDEATSNLDVRTEVVINDAIKRMKITRIIFAHRKETLEAADRIIHLPDCIAASRGPRMNANVGAARTQDATGNARVRSDAAA